MKYTVGAKIIVRDERETEASNIEDACNQVESELRSDKNLRNLRLAGGYDVIITSVKETE